MGFSVASLLMWVWEFASCEKRQRGRWRPGTRCQKGPGRDILFLLAKMAQDPGDDVLLLDGLQRVLRLSDTTARLGGDGFALILPGINVPTDIEIIMQKVLAEVRKPIKIDNVDVVVHASCGVAIYPDHSSDHDLLCRYADKAMYLAKERQDSYVIFDDSMRSGQKTAD